MPRVRGLRPTTDAMRETLFNILGDRVADARFLDLFAGCGAVGIEALSRGARSCTLVDVSPQCVRAIRENLSRARLAERAEVRRADAHRLLRRFGGCVTYDIVFADPPYGYERLDDIVRALAGERQGLADGAVVVVQHERAASLPEELAPSRTRRFGSTAMSLYW